MSWEMEEEFSMKECSKHSNVSVMVIGDYLEDMQNLILSMFETSPVQSKCTKSLEEITSIAENQCTDFVFKKYTNSSSETIFKILFQNLHYRKIESLINIVESNSFSCANLKPK